MQRGNANSSHYNLAVTLSAQEMLCDGFAQICKWKKVPRLFCMQLWILLEVLGLFVSCDNVISSLFIPFGRRSLYFHNARASAQLEWNLILHECVRSWEDPVTYAVGRWALHENGVWPYMALINALPWEPRKYM